MQRIGWRAVLAMSTALVLAGCAQTSSPPVRPSSPVPTPAASAVASVLVSAAEQQYLKYFKVSGDVLRDGGRNPERLRPYVTGAEYKTEQALATSVRQTGRRLVGPTTTRNFTVQSQSTASHRLRAYACVDNKTSRIVDAAGKDVTPAGRVSRSTLLLTFDTSGPQPLLAASEQWTGASVC
jgi:hypothetical protein